MLARLPEISAVAEPDRNASPPSSLSPALTAFKPFGFHERPHADHHFWAPCTGKRPRQLCRDPDLVIDGDHDDVALDRRASVMSGLHWNPDFGGATSATALPVGPDLSCLQDPELFFAESPQDVEQAKALCRGCRARIACLTGALERGEPWGIWGGELLLHGAIVPRKRPRGRPPKTDVAA